MAKVSGLPAGSYGGCCATRVESKPNAPIASCCATACGERADACEVAGDFVDPSEHQCPCPERRIDRVQLDTGAKTQIPKSLDLPVYVLPSMATFQIAGIEWGRCASPSAETHRLPPSASLYAQRCLLLI